MCPPNIGDEPDIRQLGLAANEYDVGWFDIAMDQSMPVQISERIGQNGDQIDALDDGQTSTRFDFTGEGFRLVLVRIDILPVQLVVAQLHNVIPIAVSLATERMNAKQTIVLLCNPGVIVQAGKLALEVSGRRFVEELDGPVGLSGKVA